MFSPKAMVFLVVGLFVGALGDHFVIHRGRFASKNVAANDQKPASQSAAIPRHSSQSGSSRVFIDGADQPIGPILPVAEILQLKDPRQVRSLAEVLARSLDARGIKTALDEIGANHRNGARDVLQSALIRHWGEIDPPAALDYLTKSPDAALRLNSLEVLMENWARHDPIAADKWAKALPPGNNRELVMKGLIKGLLQNNPEKALDFMFSEGRTNLGEWLDPIFRKMARVNPGKAAEKAVFLPPGLWRDDAIRLVSDEWTKSDPAAAIEWGKTLAPEAQKFIFKESSRNLAQQNLDLAMKMSESASGNLQTDLISEITTELAKTDPQIALEWLKKLPPGWPQEESALRIVYAVAETDPVAAAQLAKRAQTGKECMSTVGEIARLWARRDLSSSFSWAQTLSDKDGRLDALARIFIDWSVVDPAAAAQNVVNLKNEPGYSYYLMNVGENWAQRDPAAAFQWAQSMNDPHLQGQVLRSGTDAWLEENPETLAANVSRLSDPGERSQTIKMLADRWSSLDPEKSTKWLCSLPADDQLKEPISRSVVTWAKSEPNRATAWLDTLPKGTARDTMVESFIYGVKTIDPEVAVGWAASISEPKLRQRKIRGTVAFWARLDSEAATSWVNRQAFPADEKLAILKQMHPDATGE